MEFSSRCHSTTGGITSSTLLPFGLWAPGEDNCNSQAMKEGSESILLSEACLYHGQYPVIPPARDRKVKAPFDYSMLMTV